MTRRVVVTGMGTINPLGKNVEEFWRAIKAGENGIGVLDRFDTTDFIVEDRRAGGELRPREAFSETKEARRMDRFTQFAMCAAVEAMAQAGLDRGYGRSREVRGDPGQRHRRHRDPGGPVQAGLREGPQVHASPLRADDDLQRGGGQRGHQVPRLRSVLRRGHRVRLLQRRPRPGVAPDPGRLGGRHDRRRHRGAAHARWVSAASASCRR